MLLYKILVFTTRVTFKIKNGYYLGLSTTETMKLLGSTESKITKRKMAKMFPI